MPDVRCTTSALVKKSRFLTMFCHAHGGRKCTCSCPVGRKKWGGSGGKYIHNLVFIAQSTITVIYQGDGSGGVEKKGGHSEK